MSAIEEILRDIPLPKMIKVRQNFDSSEIKDISHEMQAQLANFADTVKPGMRIAITCGSRGIHNYPLVIKETVSFLKARGAVPFIVPAMGSHGGATAEGQLKVCKAMGVTEEYCGCPIFSDMQTIEIGRSRDGHTVFIDKCAAQADGIIAVNRIKSHTGFSAPFESGLMKMIAIGLGKQHGAWVTHRAGYSVMPGLIHSFGKTIIKNCNVIFAIGLVENAYNKTYRVSVMPGDKIEQEEPKLLQMSKEKMARLLPGFADVLVVDWIGKNISGGGMDANITGRSSSAYFSSAGFRAGKVVALNLTDESNGNMHGVGNADIICRRIFDKGSLEETYPNSITSTSLKADAIPVMMANDRLAIQCAIKTCNCDDIDNVHLIRIKNTLHISEILVSEGMLDKVRNEPNMTIVGDAEDWMFDDDGNCH